jgi:hypothetical protein
VGTPRGPWTSTYAGLRLLHKVRQLYAVFDLQSDFRGASGEYEQPGGRFRSSDSVPAVEALMYDPSAWDSPGNATRSRPA